MIGVINSVLRSNGLGTVRLGQITNASAPQTVATATEAMQAFLSFGGEGWLCTADSRDVFHSAPGGVWPPPDSVWPLHGELAKEDGGRKLSLHLRRTPRGWSLVWLEETGATDGRSCLVETRLHRHKEKPEEKSRLLLCYTVAWTPEWIGDTANGHEELRPTAYRFAGFRTKEIGR